MATITTRVVRRARRAYGVKVYTHRQWGSAHRAVYAARRRSHPVSRVRADTLVQHITVTRPSGSFKADARTVEGIGMDRFRSGVSYNWLVDMRTGEVAVGQPLDAKGTHTVNDKNQPGFSRDQNAVARAIAVVGMPDTPLSGRAKKSIAGLIAAMIDVGALTPGFDYKPHSFFAFKDCPCDATRDAMPAIVAEAKRLRAGGVVVSHPKIAAFFRKRRKAARKRGNKRLARYYNRVLKAIRGEG